MDSLEKDGLEQVVQEQNDILRRFMEAEFERQAQLLKEIQHEISRRGDLPRVNVPAAASYSTAEPIQAEEVQEMVQAWNATAKIVVEEEEDLLSSWHPKPDHSKAVPNPGLEHDDDTPILAASVSALATPLPELATPLPELATPLPETPNAQERQVSGGSGIILNRRISKERQISGGRHDEKEHGGRSARPSTIGSSLGLGSQLVKNMMHGHGHGVRQSLSNEKKDLNEHQRRALRASGSFMSDKTADSNNGSASAVLRKVVTSSAFGYGIMFLILANMVILGVEVDASRHLPPDENPDYFFIINNSIVCLFVLEIILKLMAFGCKTFFCGRDRGWNIFDCIIVALSLVESASDLISRNMAAEDSNSAAPMDAGHLRVARFTRLIRALRGVRVVRLLRFISSLRAILFSISSTLGSLAWTLVLLMIVFYCFGVIIAQLVSDHCRNHLSPEDPEHLRCAVSLGMWDGVLESMMTLFHSITGGLSWVEAFTPLREISSLAAAFMYVYIVMTVFAVLNVVTGVFCNTAIENAKADKDIAVMKQMQKHRTQVEALRAVFNDIDVNQSKLISLNELKVAMQESKLGSFMESMDISTSCQQAHRLPAAAAGPEREAKDEQNDFRDALSIAEGDMGLIDADESGEISIDEFVAGCIEIQGPAKSIQLARLRHEHHLMRRDLRLVLDHLAALKKSTGPSSAGTKKK